MLETDLSTAYQTMAADTSREAEALSWCNGLIGDATYSRIFARECSRQAVIAAVSAEPCLNVWMYDATIDVNGWTV